MWEPTPEEIMKAVLIALCDHRKKSDALFIHGSPMDDPYINNGVLNMSANAVHVGMVPLIVLNGISEKTAREKHLCYPGYEPWARELINLGIDPPQILTIPACNHTAAESEALLKLAEQKSWRTLNIISAPHHQLRCFLQIIASMEKLGIDLDVYNLTFSLLGNTTREMKKPLLGGGEITGTIWDHIAAETQRIIKYAQKDGVGYTPHATIPEMLAYVKKRDKRNLS